jgi:hypothetical protein
MKTLAKAVRAKVVFFEGLEVDGYRMPDGEFRVGISGAGKVLGYAPNWLGRVLDRGGNSVKTLRGMGFTEKILEVVTQSINGGGTSAKTISINDFNRLIVYGVIDGKKAALALQLSLSDLALNDFFRDAFNEIPLTIDEKRIRFYKSYAASIRPSDWFKMDRQDIIDLALLDSIDPVLNGSWNNWQEDKAIYDVH